MHRTQWLTALAFVATAALAGCAVPPQQPEPEVAQAPVPEPSMQKCATQTGSRIATTCSNLVKSTTNKAAIAEMQRHAPMSGGN